MSPVMRILVLFLAIIGGMLFKHTSEMLNSNAPLPLLDPEQWWGDGPKPDNYAAYVAENKEIISNRLSFSQTTIEDLSARLNRTVHLPAPLEGINFEYGFNSIYLKEVIDYWRNDYLPRWREREIYLWQFNHFTTNVQGLRLHFLHLKVYDENKTGKKHYPVLLLHGWPGSVREFYDLMHMLHQSEMDDTNDYIFDVVVPSLPGYAWSQGSSKTGLGPAQIAVIMHNLMQRLGYEHYFVQGGDWGSLIGSHIATLYPSNIIGFHSNLCAVITPKSVIKGLLASYWPKFFAPEDFVHFFFPKHKELAYLIEESGYFHLQATKPDTIGAALTDNPVGLAAYILEKFSTWTNPNYRQLADGGLTKHYKLDALLDNVMIYYLTNSITTSQRIYAEAYSQNQRELKLERVTTRVPTGCVRFSGDIMHFLDFQLKDKYKNLIHSTYYQEGGHFAALEMPKLLYRDFIEFVKKVQITSEDKSINK